MLMTYTLAYYDIRTVKTFSQHCHQDAREVEEIAQELASTADNKIKLYCVTLRQCD
jgi:hypothetical protein